MHTFTHKIYSGSSCLVTCWLQGSGDVRPACLFPLVKSKCFLDSVLRHCCNVGHSCMRRVIDCSYIPHKMAWRSVARGIKAVARLGGPGCEIFDISQLRPELDSMFHELDMPPARCCWRCGLPLSCVSLVTADIDQAFEACSSSAVLLAWKVLSPAYESRFSSKSFLVRRGRRELRKSAGSQSFGRGRFSFSTPVLARTFVPFYVRLTGDVGFHGVAHPGVLSSEAVAVVLGAAELSWLKQQHEHARLGFNFRGFPVRSCVS